MATLIYRLPMSRVRFTGTRTQTVDTVLGDSVSREATAQLGIAADTKGPLSLDLDPDLLADSAAKFQLTEDGRLTGATMSVTGQGTAIVSGLVGVVGTVVGVAVRAATGAAVMNVTEGAKGATVPTSAELIEAAYARDRKADADRRKAAMATLGDLRVALHTALAQLATDRPREAAATGRRVARLAAAISVAESDVDRENAAMKVWRDSTIKTTAVAYTIDVTLDELRASDIVVRDGKMFVPSPRDDHQAAAQAKVSDGWDKLGCLVVVKDDPSYEHHEPTVIGRRDSKHVVVRDPRPATLQFYERSDTDAATLVREEPALVVDGTSHEQWIAADRAVFGKHARGLTFTSDGLLTGVDHGTSSELAGAAGALSAMPGGFATALETVGKLSGTLESLRSAGSEAALQQVKRRVDTRTQELALEGLEKTSKDYAELELLKQQAAMKQQRDIAFPAQPGPDPVGEEIAALRQQYQLNVLRRLVDATS